MSSEADYDAMISGAKIDPLASPTKTHFAHTDHGVCGEDNDMDHTHIAPLDSPVKEHHRTLSDASGGASDMKGMKSSHLEGMKKEMKKEMKHK